MRVWVVGFGVREGGGVEDVVVVGLCWLLVGLVVVVSMFSGIRACRLTETFLTC